MTTLKSWRFWIGAVAGLMLAMMVTLAWLYLDGTNNTLLVRNYGSAPLGPVSIMLNGTNALSFDVPAGQTVQTSFKAGDASLSVVVRSGATTMPHTFGYVSGGISSIYEIVVTDNNGFVASKHPKALGCLLEMFATPQAQLHAGR